MSDDIKSLKSKIAELESELKQKHSEVARYKQELVKTNSGLEKLIADFSQEFKLAAQVQKVLSPTEIPNIPGIEFSTKFNPGMRSGGDYFDIFEHEDKLRFGIIVASSSGYQMSALFLSVLIKLSGQIEARRGVEPHKVISMMAQELVPNIDNQDTASLFYAVIDRRDFVLHYSSVGNIMGFLQVHGEGSSATLEASTGALKKNYSENPLTQSLSLGPRDRLILCTEGIYEAKNKAGEVFGKDRLAKLLLRAPRSGVHDVRNEILFQLEKFSENPEPQRDQTVVVTEVKDRVIKLAKKSSL